MPEGQVQLALDIHLNTGATYDAYYAGDNVAAVRQLQGLIAPAAMTDQQVYLWGGASTGKSHLLQAACHSAARADLTSIYLPLAALRDMQPELLEELGGVGLVCVDDLDDSFTRPSWERALFNLINTVREYANRLVLASRCNPARTRTHMPDLASRLCWGPVYRLQPLDDEGKRQALKRYAGLMGLDLSDEAGRYLLNHCSRDMAHLRVVLERLDHASIQAKRRLTLPFIRSVLHALGDVQSG